MKTRSSTLLISLLLLLSGCGDTSSQPTTRMVFKSLQAPMTGLSASVTLVGVGEYPLVNQADGTWFATVPSLSPGNHQIQMTYYCHTDMAYVVASSTPLTVSIRAGEATSVGANQIAALLNKTMNQDGDAFTNLGECRMGTGIGNANSYPEVVIVSGDVAIATGNASTVQMSVLDHQGSRPLSGVPASLAFDLPLANIVGTSTCITGAGGLCSITVLGSQVGTTTIRAVIGNESEGISVASARMDITVTALPTVFLSTTIASRNEGNPTATTTATIAVSVTAISSLPVTVILGVNGASTASSGDYAIGTTTLVIPVGMMSTSTTLTPAGDTVDEPNETVIIDITGVTNGTEDGVQQRTVTINDDDPTLGQVLTAVDSGGNVGWHTAIAIGVDGFPVVSYLEHTNDHLKVAHCGNALCTP